MEEFVFKGPRKKILIVDDAAIVRNLMTGMLKHELLDIHSVDSGHAAIKFLAAEKVPPDIILMDVTMPRMDGIVTTKLIREDKKNRHIPIIMCTAKNGRSDVMEALRAGANDYIVKPFKADILRSKVVEVINNFCSEVDW